MSNMSSMEKLDLLKKVGNNIKKIREAKGLAQVDLAVKMQGSIYVTNISRIESGRTNPTLFTLYRIAEALEIKISELVDIEN